MRYLIALTLVFAALALVGCQQQAPALPPAPSTTTTPATPTAPVTPATMSMMHGIGGTADAASAKTALRTWLDCFVKGDGGILYDMMPNATRASYDQWFAKLSTNPSWKAASESAKVPTARHHLVLFFEEAKKQGSMMAPISNQDFQKIANTCKMSGNIATFINKGDKIIFTMLPEGCVQEPAFINKGEKMIFTLEPEGWKMDANFAGTIFYVLFQRDEM